MRIYLVQHGEAKSAQEDPERHLADKGIEEVNRVAQFLQPLRLKVEAVWHSGKPRAKQTAEILLLAVTARQGSLRRQGLGPNDPVAEIRQAIEPADQDLMIVGHQPFLGKLAGLLVADDESKPVVTFQFGAVVCLEQQPEKRWRVIWMVLPELLLC